MPSVETVQGAVDADKLGLTLVHEHVRFRDEAVAEEWPGRYDDELERDAALVAVNAAKAHGVQTIVDPTAMFAGRDVRFMKEVADRTGVRIVACTGIYSYDYLPPYFANRDVDVMAEHFVEDIERGIQGTDIKAAFLKCAADAAGVTNNIEKIHRAVARASVQTGASIDWFPPEAGKIFEANGAIRNWSMTLVFEEVVPALREQGVMDDAVFETIFTENPRRWLTA